VIDSTAPETVCWLLEPWLDLWSKSCLSYNFHVMGQAVFSVWLFKMALYALTNSTAYLK